MGQLLAAVQAANAKKRQSAVILGLATAAVLLACLWMVSSLPGPARLRLGLPYPSSASLRSSYTREVQPFVGDEASFGNCTVPRLDVKGLEEYGCKVLNDSCFDQNRILVHNPPDDLDFPYPFVNMGWLPGFIPGWKKLNKSDGNPAGIGNNWQPVVRKNSTEDRPDQLDPIFSACYTPIVWNSPWHVVYGEFFLNSFVPLWDMQVKRKLFDREVLLAPVLDGHRTQPFMENLLRPYTNKFISTFQEISSREHMYEPKYPRCFKKVAICGLKGLYKDRPPPKYLNPDTNTTMYNGDKTWTWYQPARAGKNLVDFYRKEGKLLKPPKPKAEGTLQIVFGKRIDGYRMFLNLTEFLTDCNAWTPPPPYKRTSCSWITFSPKTFLQDVSVLQETDILVTHHGATANHAVFLPWRASIVEVRPHGFAEDWAQVYVPSVMRTENEIFYWFVKVESDGTWEPAPWEKDGRPHHFYELERNTVLKWEQWVPIFTNITAVKRSKAAYEKLRYPFNVRFII